MKILCGSKFYEEKNYIISFILNEFLGIDAEIHFSETLSSEYEIKYDKKSLKISDVFFNQNKNGWLSTSWLPQLPLSEFKFSEYGLQKCSLHSKIPIFYPSMDSDRIVINNGNTTHLNLDIFGTAFFFLTRYEEFVSKESDIHGRFPYKSSILSQNSLISRPVVNEYIEILWSLLKKIWPHLKRKKREFRINLTHDIDRPVFLENQNTLDMALYDRVMSLAEINNITSTYFFLSSRTSDYDADYTLEDAEIQKLMLRIHLRGHKIGLHPSYFSIRSREIIKREFQTLCDICERLNIHQRKWESRQHYLRYYPVSTSEHLEYAGISYDSTLGFAERIGFRCGFSDDFPFFNLRQAKRITLREKPLMIMDDTITAEIYMGLSLDDQIALDACLNLKEECKYHQGTLTILFHDNYLNQKPYFTFLENLLGQSLSL